MSRLILLDRDGVINFDSLSYIRCPEDWEPIPGSLEAITRLHQAGYQIGVATNQSGIARGFYDHDMLSAIHTKMNTALKTLGGQIHKIVYCPHHPDDGCVCRKPKPALLNELAEYFQQPLEGVPYVGDRISDVETAQNAGATPFLVNTGTSPIAIPPEHSTVPRFADLYAVSDYLLCQP